jgi:hypothetical protein
MLQKDRIHLSQIFVHVGIPANILNLIVGYADISGVAD